MQLYDDIREQSQDRNVNLEDTLEVAEKFWDDYHGLAGNIKELQDNLGGQESPALEPAIIREQQDFLEVGVTWLSCDIFLYLD